MGGTTPAGTKPGMLEFGSMTDASGLSTGVANTVGNKFGKFAVGTKNLLGNTVGSAISNVNIGSRYGCYGWEKV